MIPKQGHYDHRHNYKHNSIYPFISSGEPFLNQLTAANNRTYCENNRSYTYDTEYSYSGTRSLWFPNDALLTIGYEGKELESIPQSSILGVGCGAEQSG